MALVLAGLVGGCIDLTDPTLQAALTGPYIVSGVMELDPKVRACSVFHEDSGVTYVLFQGLGITNEDFDAVFQDGARLRLEVDRRDGIPTNCHGGIVAQVNEVLEIIPADAAASPQ